jgi:hypothetical protein
MSNPLKEYIHARLTELYEIEAAFATHEMIFGIPCGPTLSMTDPSKLAYYIVRDKEAPNA